MDVRMDRGTRPDGGAHTAPRPAHICFQTSAIPRSSWRAHALLGGMGKAPEIGKRATSGDCSPASSAATRGIWQADVACGQHPPTYAIARPPSVFRYCALPWSTGRPHVLLPPPLLVRPAGTAWAWPWAYGQTHQTLTETGRVDDESFGRIL